MDKMRIRRLVLIAAATLISACIPRLIEESGKSLRLAQGWIRMAA